MRAKTHVFGPKYCVIVSLPFQDRITQGIISHHTLPLFLFVFAVLELMR